MKNEARRALIKKIETQITKTLASVGHKVQVVCRGEAGWTLLGERGQVAGAVAYMTGNGIMGHEETIFDDELGESFAYMTA